MKSSFLKPLATLALFPALVVGAARASWDISANVDLTTRSFTEDARWPGQDDATTQLSIGGAAEFRWRGDSSRASIIPTLRYDETDDERSLADLQEAYWAKEAESFELLVGINTVFWGVTESVHLVDIVNQTDAVADIDGEDKLGQPMIDLEMQRDWGLVGVYLLPRFRERTFAGEDGRLRTPLPVDTDNPQYESSDEYNHVDLALRYSHFIGSVDIGLSAFSGTSREPKLVPNADGSALIPFYDQIDQLGLDLQYTGDAWLWKLETIARETKNDSFTAAVGGFEYTFYGIFEGSADLGALFEVMWDERGGDATTPFNRDLFVGLRWVANDVDGTEVLAGVINDWDNGSRLFNLEASRRLGNDWKLGVQARLWDNIDDEDPTYGLRQDDYLEIKLTRFF